MNIKSIMEKGYPNIHDWMKCFKICF